MKRAASKRAMDPDEEMLRERQRLIGIYDRGRGKTGSFYDGFTALAKHSLKQKRAQEREERDIGTGSFGPDKPR